MITLIDLIFKGDLSQINFNFLDTVISQSENVNFMFPENISATTFDDIIKVFKHSHYADLTISIRSLTLNNLNIRNVFFNLGHDNKDVELLLFFDVKDINNNFQQGLEILHNWSISFYRHYGFDSFFCHTDGTINENDYYFKSPNFS